MAIVRASETSYQFYIWMAKIKDKERKFTVERKNA